LPDNRLSGLSNFSPYCQYGRVVAYSRETFIDLGRRFLPVSRDKNGEEAALESYSSLTRWMLEKSTLGWNEISGHRLVVILGEPSESTKRNSWSMYRK
jgi:hypothetical protein